MIILSAKEITKEYGIDTILSNVSFHVNEGDRVGIIGANGAGKTTLLKILTGEMPCESGEIFISQETTIGYLKQQDGFDSGNTIIQEAEKIFDELKQMEEEMLELSALIPQLAGSPDQEDLLHRYDRMVTEYDRRGGYTYKSELRGILNSMAFTEDQYDKPIAKLSGGERTRLSLALLLLKKPNLLFLDEPTNHLDIGTLKWLEQYLKSYKGTIMLVSHDRYFLDQTVNRIFEVENHKLYKYEGTYSQYAEKKRARREEELRKYQSQQKEIEKQEEIVRRFKGHGTEKLAKRAASREKKLDKIERVARPEGEHGKMKIRFREKFQSGKDVIQAEGLAKSFGYGRNKVELFHQVDFDIKRGERICIVGPNGIGKTTLMKMIMGETEANAGYLKKGHNVKFGYYDQGQRLLNEENTVIEELQEAYSIYSDTEMRSILGRFLFKNDTVFLPIKALSGGEKARLSLLKLMLSGANVLMLDEPTNHLDIDSKEIFEDALLDFPGTSLVVSHDRYFLSKVPTRIVELGHEGLTNFLGKYDYYVEKKQEIQSGKKYLQEMAKDGEVQEETSTQELTAAQERKQKKEEEARQRRIAREKAQLEQEIEETESKIAEIEAEMCKEETLADYAKLEEMNQELQENKEKLPKIYQKWLQCEEC